jgi:hypothetical protein
MDGFRTARALVLDNSPQEAAPVIQALGGLGVAVVFHTGDNVSPVPKKHRGIRLLVVDMVLENCGASADNPAECASILVGTLGQIIEDDHHPIIVVCWTKHAEFKEQFESAFRDSFPKFQIDSVLLFEKQQLLSEPELLLSNVRGALEKSAPFSLLLDWEQQVHDAATLTTSELSRLISQGTMDGSAWSGIAFKLCACLAVASRGTRVSGEGVSVAAASLFEALNPLLLDRLETGQLGTSTAVEVSGKSLAAAAQAEVAALKPKDNGKKDSLVSKEIRSSLNSMLHLAASEGAGRILPGNVFAGPIEEPAQSFSEPSIPTIVWSSVLADTFSLKGGPPAKLIRVLLEITPACDFAQQKATVSRIVPGYLVLEADQKKIPDRSNFVIGLGPYSFTGHSTIPDGIFRLVFNVHFMTSVKLSDAAQWPTLFRLRQGALTQVASFLGAHISRTGLMKIEP